MQKHLIIRRNVAIGIFLFFLILCMIPSYGQNVSEKTVPSAKMDSILYVGGNGGGNYSNIQDAIDDADPGDTVYVYNDSSPYLESVVIDKSISLIGEDKTSTEINGSLLSTSLDTVTVLSDHVTIGGFRITDNHGYHYQAAMKIKGDYTILSDCIMNENEWIGIYLDDVSFCQVGDCELYDNLVAIYLVHSGNNILRNCVCHDNADAITLFQASDENQIISCICDRNRFDGILIQQSSGNQIIGCVCQNGYDGISLPYAPDTKMRNNSMMDNYANFGIGSSSISDLSCDIDTSNTINGKPMYYLIEQHNLLFDETTEIGFLGLVNCHNISVKKCNFTNNFEGILLAGTTDSVIENCSFRNNEGHGMYLISAQNNTIKTSTFRNSYWDGLFLYDSSNNMVSNCSYYESLAGVNLGLSTHNTFQGQTFDQCDVGISFDASGNNVLKDNEMVRCGVQVTGFSPADYQNEVDTSNTVNGKPLYYYVNKTNMTIPLDAGQVILTRCVGCIVSQCNLSDASIGIILAYSTMNVIEGNILRSNSIVAIDLDCSDNDNNLIQDNIIQGNNYGIDVDSSNSNYIQGNLLTENGMGLSFDSCWDNRIVGNTVQNGYYGISLDQSSDNILTNNTISNTSIFGMSLLFSNHNILGSNAMLNCSLMMYGNQVSDYQNDIDTSNTVNGKPVYYLFGQRQMTIPKDAGEVILIASYYCTIEGLNLDKGTIGILIAHSSHNIIQDNKITNQSVTAIDLGSTNNDGNIIQGNIIQGNGYGIDVEYSKGNIIRKNHIVSNVYGVFLSHTLNSIILRNTISRNSIGISVAEANESRIFLNNINQNYGYGLAVEACLVTARWNWWGAITGPNTDENGDHLRITEEGQINYTPWLRRPVLFTGIIRNLLMSNHQKKHMDVPSKMSLENCFQSQQTTLTRLDLFGLKSMDPGIESVLPKTAAKQYFDK